MSKTVRLNPLARKRMPDGKHRYRVARSCDNHGSCPRCVGDRMYNHAKLPRVADELALMVAA